MAHTSDTATDKFRSRHARASSVMGFNREEDDRIGIIFFDENWWNCRGLFRICVEPLFDATVLTVLPNRFWQLTFSTRAPRLRPASTSSRYVTLAPRNSAIRPFSISLPTADIFPPPADPGPRPPVFLHGRQVLRLLHHHDRLLPRPDRCHLPGMHDRSLPADWWKGPAYRGLLFPEKVDG